MKCLVLAGGTGDRLWPASRRNYPKQFMNVKENRSLFQETIARNMPFCDEFYIMTNEKYQYIVEGQMQAFQGLKYRCFLEQAGRKTAPAAAIICMCINPSDLLLIVSTDTIIDGGDYRKAILDAKNLVNEGWLVSLGVSGKRGVKLFTPNAKLNESTCNEIGLVDAGILMLRAGDYLHELKICSPYIYEPCRFGVNSLNTAGKIILLKRQWMENIPAESIASAITQRSEKVRIYKADLNWSRILDLESLSEYHEFRQEGRVIEENCRDISILNYAKGKIVIANEMEDTVIVNTDDAVYVSRKGKTQAIKDIMRKHYREEKKVFDESSICYQPWGMKEILTCTPEYKVKRITIFPGKVLPGHKHQFRSEHWAIVGGVATITLNEESREYGKKECVYIPMGTLHQIANYTSENIIVVETSIGKILEEADYVKNRLKSGLEVEIEDTDLVKLEPAFKDYLWGGSKLRDIYHKHCDYDCLAESWELSTHGAGQSVVAEGKYKGLLFGEYIARIGRENLGWKCQSYEKFPLLIKFIDARDMLSIQVHPGDDYALPVEDEYGKNEMWYIMDCDEDAYIYYGFNKDVAEEEVRKRIDEQTLTEILNKVPVHKGESIFVEAGTVHAIGPGILVCEVQQNSNATYRLYDYGRRDRYGELRELHIEKALDVIQKTRTIIKPTITEDEILTEGYTTKLLGECKYFSCMKYHVKTFVRIVGDESSFYSIMILSGSGELQVENTRQSFKPGESFFVPAGKKNVQVTGYCEFLLTQV